MTGIFGVMRRYLRDRARALSKSRGFRRTIWIVVSIIGVFLIDLFVRIAIHRAGLDALGTFWGKFIISPAVAGLAALVAAIIGAVMISKQLQHTKDKDFDSSWWEKFEWTTDRAYPPVVEAPKIPHSLASTLLQALQSTATDNVQKRACGGFMDHLSALEAEKAPAMGQETRATEPTNDLSEKDDAVENLRYAALANYVEATKNTPARSVVTEGLVYEWQVIKALAEIDGVMLLAASESLGESGFDAEVVFNNCIIEVEVKYWDPNGVTHARALQRIRRALARLNSTGTKRPLLFVTPTIFGIGESEIDEIVEFAKWTPESGNGYLESALKLLSERAGSSVMPAPDDSRRS